MMSDIRGGGGGGFKNHQKSSDIIYGRSLIVALTIYTENDQCTALHSQSNQITVVAFQPVQLAQGSFLPKNQTLQNAFFICNADTGIPRLARFQLVRSPVQCGLQIALNSAIPRFSAVFSLFSFQIFFFFKNICKTFFTTLNSTVLPNWVSFQKIKWYKNLSYQKMYFTKYIFGPKLICFNDFKKKGSGVFRHEN